MIVYTLKYVDWDIDEFEAAFSTRELAKAHMAELNKTLKKRSSGFYIIDEIDIDPPLPIVRKILRIHIDESGKILMADGKPQMKVFYPFNKYYAYYCPYNKDGSIKFLSLYVEGEKQKDAVSRAKRLHKMVIEAGLWGNQEGTGKLLHGQFIEPHGEADDV